MGNVFAVGTPDNISAAERDNRAVNEAFAKVKFGKDNFGSIKNFTRSTKHEKKKRNYRKRDGNDTK